MNTDTQITYNLSNIPGFSKLVFNDESYSDEKYYSSHLFATKSDEKYKIVRFNNELLHSESVSTYGLLRSVIVSGKKVVCFSPPKSMSGETFMSKYPVKTDNIVAEEFIEGTMINVFFDPTYNSWQIATSDTVGAEVAFDELSTKTINQMFFEACAENNCDIKLFNTNYCWSFVLQHPENRMGVLFNQPQLYLVGGYEINQDGDKINVIENNVSEHEIEQWRLSGINIKFPERYEYSSYSELIEKIASHDVSGVILKNIETGERTKLRNPYFPDGK